jgi:hypothetical protein
MNDTQNKTGFKSFNTLNHDDKKLYENDVTGWNVLGDKKHLVGRVKDALVDERTHEVRYLIIEVDKETDWEILMPIGHVSANQDPPFVWLEGYSKQDIALLPRYDRNHINRDFEMEVLNKLKTRNVEYPEARASDFYNNKHFLTRTIYKSGGSLSEKMNRSGDTKDMNFGG